jgi:capsular polysaccharide biosynthesis protein
MHARPRPVETEGGHMELREYGLALRRHWKTLAGVLLVSMLAAVVVVVSSPRTYEATAQVFVASTGDGTSGSQFVMQRVKSYPDVAESRAVLGTVIDQLELQESFSALRARVSATNPADTSQIDIAVTGPDPVQAAEVADAVAERFGTVVEELERPLGGNAPVDLTVTDPATVPSTPVSPVPVLILTLGALVGISLGAAAAIVRSRLDPRVYDTDDVREALGAGDDGVAVHVAPRGRRRNSPGRRPATQLARQLEPLAVDRPLRVVVVSAVPDDHEGARSLVDDVTAQLEDWDVPAAVGATTGGDRNPPRVGVYLSIGSTTASLRSWRRLADELEGAVLVVEQGRVDLADLIDARAVLAAAGIRLLAVVLQPRRRGPAGTASPTPKAPPVPSTAPRRTAVSRGPVPAGRR